MSIIQISHKSANKFGFSFCSDTSQVYNELPSNIHSVKP